MLRPGVFLILLYLQVLLTHHILRGLRPPKPPTYPDSPLEMKTTEKSNSLISATPLSPLLPHGRTAHDPRNHLLSPQRDSKNYIEEGLAPSQHNYFVT